MLDSILTLWQDTFVYDELVRGITKKIPLSRLLTKKICAIFADVCNYIPILKYQSNVSWAASIYGPDSIFKRTRKDSVFRKSVPLLDILTKLKHENNENWPRRYDIDDLVDPIMFNEFQHVISKLTPSEILWLATHRTLRHTYRCVLRDFNLWQVHLERIFERLSFFVDAGLCSRSSTDISFYETEIAQAAKDIKLVLLKIQNRDKMRFKIREKLKLLAKLHPIASNIHSSIETSRKINPLLILRNEARRTLTTILRLFLCNQGLAYDKRAEKKPIQSYIYRLEVLLNKSLFNGQFSCNVLRDALVQNNSREFIEQIHKMFEFLSKPEDLGSWMLESDTLDKWFYIDEK